MTYISIYLIIFFLIPVWDAYIGFGIEFDGRRHPPLTLVMLFWPFAIPIYLIVGIVIALEHHLGSVKKKRLVKNNEQ